MAQLPIQPVLDCDVVREEEEEEYWSEEESAKSSEVDDGPSTSIVVGALRKGDFTMPSILGGKNMDLIETTDKCKRKTKEKKIKSKNKSAPLLRRLRVYDSKKASPAKRKLQETDPDPMDDPEAKNQKVYNVQEPVSLRKSDDEALETHPVLMFLREHTPVRPCGRCHECRKPPCNECTNCKNNQHLPERSRDRKRCIAHGCSKLTDEELVKYRAAYAEEDKMGQIERDLRELRDRLMVEEKNADMLEQEQKKLLEMLGALQEKHVTMEEEVPDGYECLLLSVQTMETERDRIARLVKRRTTRDSPEVMRTRRQLRNYYGLRICDLVRKFATDMIARPHVHKLIEIAAKYEDFVADSNKQMASETM